MDALPWQTLGAASGGWVLTAAFVYALITGRLVPRSTMDDALHDRDEWRTESRIKDAQLAEKDKQLGHLAEVGRTVKNIMRALQKRSTEREGP